MDTIFQQLFENFCFSYDSDQVPEGRDPVRAYGRYAFEQGFKLAMRLSACALPPDDLDG